VLETPGSARHAIRSPSDAVALGVGYLPEDRNGRAAFGDQSLLANVSVAHLPSLTGRLRCIDRAAERTRVEALFQSLRVKHSNLEQHVSELSGGNQQKVMLARWLFTGSRVLILDEPTQGVDVGAKAEILRLLERLLSEGKALLVVTADAEEFLGLASRVHVMQRGRIVRTFEGPGFDGREIARTVLTPHVQHDHDPRRTA
jgi:ABC-type sugar transport system ATPase subunit